MSRETIGRWSSGPNLAPPESPSKEAMEKVRELLPCGNEYPGSPACADGDEPAEHWCPTCLVRTSYQHSIALALDAFALAAREAAIEECELAVISLLGPSQSEDFQDGVVESRLAIRNLRKEGE